MGTTGGPHCADASEGRQQGATAAFAAGDAARALRSAVLQSGDVGPACEAESVQRLAGGSPEKVPDEEGEPAAFRDEAAHRHRPPGSGAPSAGNGRLRRDLTPSGRLLHGEEEQVRTDAGYRGIGKRAEHAHREVSR